MNDGRARPALRRASERDLDGRVRRHAREAIKAIGDGTARDDQAATLRQAVEKLEEENLSLRERLFRLEARLGVALPPKDDRQQAGAAGGSPAPGDSPAETGAEALLNNDASPEATVRHEGKES
jgi:HEAT repeat protein